MTVRTIPRSPRVFAVWMAFAVSAAPMFACKSDTGDSTKSDDKADDKADDRAEANDRGEAEAAEKPGTPDTSTGACKLAPVFASGCPLTPADAQAALGIDDELTLDTKRDDGACRVMLGEQRVLFVTSKAISPEARGKRLKSFKEQTDLGFSESVDLGLSDCPTMFRGSTYNHMHVAGAETFVEIKVDYPASEGDDPEAMKAMSAKRLEVAKRVAAKLFGDMK